MSLDGMHPIVRPRARYAILLFLMATAPVRAVPESVRIATIVTDRAGKPVMGLTLKDFQLREDGVVQKLVAVEPHHAEPRRIAILLDEFHVELAERARGRDAVTRFVDDRLRHGDPAGGHNALDSL